MPVNACSKSMFPPKNGDGGWLIPHVPDYVGRLLSSEQAAAANSSAALPEITKPARASPSAFQFLQEMPIAVRLVSDDECDGTKHLQTMSFQHRVTASCLLRCGRFDQLRSQGAGYRLRAGQHSIRI